LIILISINLMMFVARKTDVYRFSWKFIKHEMRNPRHVIGFASMIHQGVLEGDIFSCRLINTSKETGRRRGLVRLIQLEVSQAIGRRSVGAPIGNSYGKHSKF